MSTKRSGIPLKAEAIRQYLEEREISMRGIAARLEVDHAHRGASSTGSGKGAGLF